MIRHISAAAAMAALAGCGGQGDEAHNQAAAEGTSILAPVDDVNAAAADAKESVMRPSVVNEVEPAPPPAPEPFRAVVSFADGGADLSDEMQPVLDQLLKAAQEAGNAPIVIRGHTDSKGNDEANRRVSLKRAEAVRDYLADKGVAEERMTVIGLGETRPVAPNALLSGEDDEAGRRKNRRVVAIVGVPEKASDEAEESAPAVENETGK